MKAPWQQIPAGARLRFDDVSVALDIDGIPDGLCRLRQGSRIQGPIDVKNMKSDAVFDWINQPGGGVTFP